jgi:hypothetical protein
VTMKLQPGTRRTIELEPVEGGRLKLTHRLRVGNSGSRDLSPPKIVANELEAFATIEIWAQEELARAGLVEVRKR